MKFNTGTLCFSSGVYAQTQSDPEFLIYVLNSFCRHRDGDWGCCCPEDKRANEEALKHGSRVISSYDEMDKIWIITEYDRSATTILFPGEY